MKVVIVAAQRSAIGSFLGAFADVPAGTLGTTVAPHVLSKAESKDVADVIIGNVLQAGRG